MGNRQGQMPTSIYSSSESDSSPLESSTAAQRLVFVNQTIGGMKILGITGSCEPELCLSNSRAVFWSCWILLSCSDLLIGLFFFFGAGLATARGLSRSRICFLIVASTSGAYCMIKPWIFQRVGVLMRSMSSSSVPSSPT